VTVFERDSRDFQPLDNTTTTTTTITNYKVSKFFYFPLIHYKLPDNMGMRPQCQQGGGGELVSLFF
jgi:hypothetical protein